MLLRAQMSPVVVTRVLKGLTQAKAQGLHLRAPSTVAAAAAESVSQVEDSGIRTAEATEHTEKLRLCFKALDKDGSGCVGCSDLRNHLSQAVSHTLNMQGNGHTRGLHNGLPCGGAGGPQGDGTAMLHLLPPLSFTDGSPHDTSSSRALQRHILGQTQGIKVEEMAQEAQYLLHCMGPSQDEKVGTSFKYLHGCKHAHECLDEFGGSWPGDPLWSHLSQPIICPLCAGYTGHT